MNLKKPTNKVLDKIDMSSILANIPETDTNRVYIDMPSGQEHYRLLAWLGTKVKGQILELGTFRGHSSLCLGMGGKDVWSYDVENHLSINKIPGNINFSYSNTGHICADSFINLIFIDTLHDGIYEAEVLQYLRDINWKGIVVMDDIDMFPELSILWHGIPERKEDWTDIGHHSGTGIVYFE